MNSLAQGKAAGNRLAVPDESLSLDWHKLARNILRSKWYIMASTGLCLLIACIYCLTIIPMYETSALIEVDSSSNKGIGGSLGYKGVIGGSHEDLELLLIKSRYILEPIVTQNNLNVMLKPKYYPYFGEYYARHHSDGKLAKPLLGLKKYAWGGEEYSISDFKIYEDPNQFYSFKVIANDKQSFDIYYGKDKIANGKLGEVVESSQYPKFKLVIGKLKAHKGVEFNLNYIPPSISYLGLANQIRIKPIAGNNPMENSGLWQIMVFGADGNKIVDILNKIVAYAIDKNKQLKSEETKATWAFLNQRIPELGANLDKAELELANYRSKMKSLSIAMTNQVLAKRYLDLVTAQTKLKTNQESLEQIYTPNHPTVITNKKQIEKIETKLASIASEIQKAPYLAQNELKLMREAKIKNILYTTMLSRVQQLEVINAGVVSTLKPLGYASPAMLLPSYRLIKLAMGCLIGVLISLVAIVTKTVLSKSIENAEQLEYEIGIPIYAVVPYSSMQKKMERNRLNNRPLILSNDYPNELAIESLRSLRMTLQFQKMKQDGCTIIAIMGTLSNIGKSFVSLNLASLLTESGKRTLLIDADIRRGHLDVKLGKPKTPGLCEYIEGSAKLDQVVHPITDQLYFISAGKPINHNFQLFETNRFKDFIELAKKEFDQIIIDTAPLISVAESLIIGHLCDVKLLVVSQNDDDISTVKHAAKKALLANINIDGLIFNHSKFNSLSGSQLSNYTYEYTS